MQLLKNECYQNNPDYYPWKEEDGYAAMQAVIDPSFSINETIKQNKYDGNMYKSHIHAYYSKLYDGNAYR